MTRMERENCNCELRDRQWNGYGKCLRCGGPYVDKREPLIVETPYVDKREPLIVETPTVLTRIDEQLKTDTPPKLPKLPKLPKSSKPDKGDEDLGNVVGAATRAILADPSAASTKRVAWAYGCIRAGSEEEEPLLAILKSRLA